MKPLTLAALFALSAASVFAQGTQGMTTTGPMAGSGTGAGAPAPGSQSATHHTLDLPLERPVYVGPPTPEEPPTPPPSEVPPAPPPEMPAEPPPTFFGEEIPSENDTIFYVIDRSGSMSLDSQSFVGTTGDVTTGNKMDRAKAELTRSIQGLARNFRFSMLAYNCSVITWSATLKEASGANKADAIKWVSALVASGRTGTGPATSLALADNANMSVVLLTDGAPNCGADGFSGHRMMIAAQNDQGAVVNVFGIAASSSYREFCQNVAADSGGSYFDVP